MSRRIFITFVPKVEVGLPNPSFAVTDGLVGRTLPNKPRSSSQRYRHEVRGRAFHAALGGGNAT